MGLHCIMGARHILLLCNGPEKHAILKQAIGVQVRPQEVPASILQLHPNVDVLFFLSAEKNGEGKRYFEKRPYFCQRAVPEHGSFRVEDGGFHGSPDLVPTGDGIDIGEPVRHPGLIDVHNHGNSGADFSDGDYDGLVKMARYLAQNGVTSFAPTSMTLPYDVLETAYKTAVQLKKAQPEGSPPDGHPHGGPFSPRKKGARRTATT